MVSLKARKQDTMNIYLHTHPSLLMCVVFYIFVNVSYRMQSLLVLNGISPISLDAEASLYVNWPLLS